MALETDNPAPKRPKEPQPKDVNAPFAEEHDTTAGDFYGTTEGVKESDTQFEQVEVPKKQASNVVEPKPGDVEESDATSGGEDKSKKGAKKAAAKSKKAAAAKRVTKRAR